MSDCDATEYSVSHSHVWKSEEYVDKNNRTPFTSALFYL